MFVEADARSVRQRDAGEGVGVAAVDEVGEQPGVERPGRAGAPRAFGHIGADIAGPSIGCAAPVGRRIGVGDDGAAGFGDEPGMGLEGLRDARGHLVGARRRGLERDEGVAHDGCIDRGEGGSVAGRGGS